MCMKIKDALEVADDNNIMCGSADHLSEHSIGKLRMALQTLRTHYGVVHGDEGNADDVVEIPTEKEYITDPRDDF